MTIDFIKMSACGNDFMIIDLRSQLMTISQEKITELADYKRSIGFDQLITIENSDISDVSVRIFNRDGNEVGACGNGSRCVARLILEESKKDSITIATKERVLVAKLQDGFVAINMGKARLKEENINFGDIVGDLVDIGNPHIVIKSNLDRLKYGPIIENDPRFPEKVNVNFAHIIDKNLVELSTWERGAGATLSCGTGACATFFLLNKQGFINKEAIIKQIGGLLSMSIINDEIFMAGETKINYRGTI